MKQYVISEEELIDLTHNEDYNNFDIPKVKDFLKSRKPVKEIASGELKHINVETHYLEQVKELGKLFPFGIKLYIQK